MERRSFIKSIVLGGLFLPKIVTAKNIIEKNSKIESIEPFSYLAESNIFKLGNETIIDVDISSFMDWKDYYKIIDSEETEFDLINVKKNKNHYVYKEKIYIKLKNEYINRSKNNIELYLYGKDSINNLNYKKRELLI